MSRSEWLTRRLREPSWQDPLFAAGLFGVGALLYLSKLYTLYSPSGDVPAWRLGLLAAACAPLLLRRRRPVLALALAAGPITADVVFGFNLATAFVLGDLLFCVTLYGSKRVSRVMVVLAVATPAVTLLVALAVAAEWRLAVLLTLQVVALLLIPVGWGRDVRQHREIATAERTRAAQLARIGELDRAAAIAEERSRMARDLHDVVAGHLSAIALQSEAVLSMADRDPATVRTVLGSVRENSVAALVEMRAMIDLLRAGRDEADPPVAPARLVDLDRLLESARAGGLRVEPTGPLPPEPLPSVIDLTAYRIVQEALTNAVKHAEGARAWVSVRRDGPSLLVEVINELPGPAVAGTGIGLASMTERAEAVGGSLSAGPGAPGWRVRAELPADGLGGPGQGVRT
ncbi:sensor histidine kinase [Pseudonocardia acaciae]|uniref:sensor histidine kinase n=1 Tax=Pseudonocardia acaciae TaxID=551276 RepID=UPI0007E8BD69|nr:sensor histidine kinase [Pseudonocardia acaciae]